MKFSIVFLVNMLLVTWSVIGANINLVPNPEMKSKNGKWPDGWSVNRAFKIFNVQDGILSIPENSPHYTNYVSFTANVDGFKSYKFSIDVKLENIEKQTAIFYHWLNNKSAKVSRKANFIFKGNGNKGWKTIETVLSADNSAVTSKIAICLNVYNQKDSNGKTFFKNPKLYEINQEEAQKIKTNLAKQKQKTRQYSYGKLNNKSFHYNFTMKPTGIPYCVEQGFPGYFPMVTNHKYTKSIILKVTAPTKTAFELYLYTKKYQKCKYIEPASIEKRNDFDTFTFKIPKGISWRVFGNSLFFKASNKCPENFTVKLNFSSTAGEKLAVFSIPVKIIKPFTKTTLSKSFRFYSWYSYPLARIDIYNTLGKLPKEMFKNWQDSGFAGGNAAIKGAKNWSTYNNFTYILPFWSKSYPSMQRGITVGGAKTALICPSVLIAAGPNFFKQCIRNKKKEKFVKTGSPRIVTDYEAYAGRNGWVTKSCFCPECIKKFAKYIKISYFKLTPKIILSKYEKLWIKFRCIQRSQVVKAMADAVHQLNPKAKFILCSMPMPSLDEAARYFKQYGINLKLYDSFVDYHMPMNYNPGIVCYKRLEQNARNLKKIIYPVLDNGWGKTYNYYPERTQLQVLTVAMLGGPGHYSGAGLLRMDGKWLKMFKTTNTQIARIETFIKNSYLGEKDLQITPGLFAEKNLYYVYRKNKAGKLLLLILNNSNKDTIFCKIANSKLQAKYYSIKNLINSNLFSPDNQKKYFSNSELAKGFKIKLKPFEYLLLEFSPGKAIAHAELQSSEIADLAERSLKLKLKSLYKSQKKHGMSTQMTLKGYLLQTPSQSLLVDLTNSAVGLWRQKTNLIAKMIASDCFVFPETLKLSNKKAKMLSCAINNNNITAVFSYKINNYTYKGLILEKTYIVHKKHALITVKVKIIPEDGYRPFRYQVSNILGIGMANNASLYSGNIIYKIPNKNKVITDNKTDIAIYVKRNAKFPNAKPFFAQYAKEKAFSGIWAEAINKNTKQKIKTIFGNADELFLWRRGNTATLEWIYPDAYPDNDPHKVKTWSTSYTLQYKK